MEVSRTKCCINDESLGVLMSLLLSHIITMDDQRWDDVWVMQMFPDLCRLKRDLQTVASSLTDNRDKGVGFMEAACFFSQL